MLVDFAVHNFLGCHAPGAAPRPHLEDAAIQLRPLFAGMCLECSFSALWRYERASYLFRTLNNGSGNASGNAELLVYTQGGYPLGDAPSASTPHEL